MFKNTLALSAVMVACAGATGQDEGVSQRVKQKVEEIQRRWRDTSAEQITLDRETTVAALAAIVKAESSRDDSFRLKYRALQELGAFADVRDAVDILIEEIAYGHARYVDSSPPISYYPAAMSLIRIGVPARGRILRALYQPLPDHKLSLMVTILVRLDQDGDGLDGVHGSSTSLTMFRLTQELEQLKVRAFAADIEEDRVTRMQNVRRMIALLLEPHFGLKTPGVGVRE